MILRDIPNSHVQGWKQNGDHVIIVSIEPNSKAMQYFHAGHFSEVLKNFRANFLGSILWVRLILELRLLFE